MQGSQISQHFVPPSTLVLLGGGSFGREVMAYALDCGVSDLAIVDETVGPGASISFAGRTFLVYSDWNQLRAQSNPAFSEFIVAVGAPSLKRQLVGRALQAGLRPSRTLVHPDAAVYGSDTRLGRGGVVAPGARLTTNIVLGDYVVVNLNCTIGHDTSVGDFCTLNPGVHLSGNVVLGDGVTFGTGAVVKEKTRVAAGVVVGAQACVLRDVTAEGVTVVGVPAKAR